MAASPKPNAAADAGDKTLVIARVFGAPRGRMFEAWTRKEDLERWCARLRARP